MAKGCGVIVSELEPERDNRYCWFKPSENKWFAPSSDLSSWELITDLETALGESAVQSMIDSAISSHSHPEHGDINFTGGVSADGASGLSGQRTLHGYTLTFSKGLLVGFSQD